MKVDYSNVKAIGPVQPRYTTRMILTSDGRSIDETGYDKRIDVKVSISYWPHLNDGKVTVNFHTAGRIGNFTLDQEALLQFTNSLICMIKDQEI